MPHRPRLHRRLFILHLRYNMATIFLALIALVAAAIQYRKRQKFARSSILWSSTLSAIMVSLIADQYDLSGNISVPYSILICSTGIIIGLSLLGSMFLALRNSGKISPLMIKDRRKAWAANMFLLLSAALIILSLSTGPDSCRNSKCMFLVNIFGGDFDFTATFLAILLFNAVTLASLLSSATLINSRKAGSV